MKKILSILFIATVVLTSGFFFINNNVEAATAPATVWDKYTVSGMYVEGTWEYKGCSGGTAWGYPNYSVRPTDGYFQLSGDWGYEGDRYDYWDDFGQGFQIARKKNAICENPNNPNDYWSGYNWWSQKAVWQDMRGALVESNVIGSGYPDNGPHTDGYWYVKKTIQNNVPVLTVNQSNLDVGKGIITLQGTIQDLDNDAITISATINGKLKSVVINNTVSVQSWKLEWANNEIIEGKYSNIIVTASDGK